MAGISKYLGDLLLNAAFRNTAFTVPTNVYLALYTSNPGDTDTGVEVTGGDYARQLVTFLAPADVGGKSTIKNSADIEFPVASASWGEITHIGIKTASIAGSLLYYGALTTAKTIESGDQFKIIAENLICDID